jgi:penicillin-binding protein 1A
MAQKTTQTKKTARKKKSDNDFRSYVRYFWWLVAAGIGSIALMVILAAVGAFGKLPTFEEIENPVSNLASTVYSSDGKIIGKYYMENRVHIEFDDLSPVLVDALIATEDERFYEHSGIDFRALARSVAKLGSAGGGSTISQQLAKMLFHDPKRSLIERIPQKFKEWVIATRIERQYTKEEIIAMYLNQFDFLYQAVGIHSASRIYFDASPSELNIEQAAVLVGMAKNPSLYNPRRDSSMAHFRRNTVYDQMVKNKLITKEERDSLSIRPIVLDFHRESHNTGLAPYFREYLRGYMKEWIREHPRSDGENYNLYTDGLKIYTSIDSRMQRYAEQAVEQHMSNLQRVFKKVDGKRSQFPFNNLSNTQIEQIIDQAERRTPRYRGLKKKGASSDSIQEVFNTAIPMRLFSWKGDIDTLLSPRDSIKWHKSFYQTGMMSVEPQTGFIKAWVGGIDHTHFKYDHVKQGRRQVGSTFKPFIYATAIRQKHYSPCMLVPNVQTCIEKGTFNLLQDWCPENSGKEYGGMVTLKYGLANSLNTVTTYLMKQIGPESVIRLAKDIGVKSEIPVQPSIALGTVDLSVYDMVGSYTAFANKGVYVEPIAVIRIEDQNGIVLDEFEPKTQEVMSEEDAYVITSLLQGVTQYGTGGRLKRKGGNYKHYNDVVTGYPWGFENPIAGKTGTTQNNSDGWFMGMVPNLITGVWTGCEDRSAHFRYTAYGQGATTALPIWALYMKQIYADPSLDVSRVDFEKPEQPIRIQLNCDEYQQTDLDILSGDDPFGGGF